MTDSSFKPGVHEEGNTSSCPLPTRKVTEPATVAKSSSEETTMPKKDKVRNWSKKDVARWLEKRNLIKFVPLFLKNGVVGADIVESKLSFLYQEDVMVEDREQILAEIYMLLQPDSPNVLRRSNPISSLRSIHPKDREKYEAALQVAKCPPSRTSAAPVVLISSRSRSSTSVTSGTTLTLPNAKQRSRSESGVEAAGPTSGALTPPSPGRKYLKRKSTPAVHDYLQRGIIQNSSLFDTLQDEKQVCLHCVEVQRSEACSKFGFSYQTLPDNCLLVTNVRSSSVPLDVGDRILEVNGILLPGHRGSFVDNVLSKSSSLHCVVVRPVHRFQSPEGAGNMSDHYNDKLQQELVLGEVRWQSLRQLLTSLQHKSFDPLSLTGALARVDDLEDVKKRITLEMEVEELQRNCAEMSTRIRDLQARLQTKEEELAAMKKERDRAVDTLRTRLLKACSPSGHQERKLCTDDDDDDLPRQSRTVESSQDLHTLFFEHIEVNLAAMEQSDATKDDVLAVLRELTQATHRHAQFVDRLISLVSERAPWMIDELNALQDASELPPDAAAMPSTPITTTTTTTATITSTASPSVASSVRDSDDERAIVV